MLFAFNAWASPGASASRNFTNTSFATASFPATNSVCDCAWAGNARRTEIQPSPTTRERMTPPDDEEGIYQGSDSLVSPASAMDGVVPTPAKRASGSTDIAAHVPKPKTHYTCQSCGLQSPKWLGRCTDCGTWSSLVEEIEARPGERHAGWGASSCEQYPNPLHQIADE